MEVKYLNFSILIKTVYDLEFSIPESNYRLKHLRFLVTQSVYNENDYNSLLMLQVIQHHNVT